MFELFILVGCVSALGAGIMAFVNNHRAAVVQYHIEGEPQRLALTASAEEKHAAIPLEIRQELDQSPEWWDGQFHQALEKAGAEKILDGDWTPEVIEQHSADGRVVMHYTQEHPYELDGCICSHCEGIHNRDLEEARESRRQRWLRAQDPFTTLAKFHREGRG